MASNPESVTSDDHDDNDEEQDHHHPPPTVRKPLAKPISVIGPAYLAPYPVDLTITEKILTLGRDYEVTDVNRDVVFKIKKHLLVDSAGNTLLTMRGKFFSTAHDQWQAFRGRSTDSNDLLFSVKRSAIFQQRVELDVFFATNISEDVCDLKIKGGPFEGSCNIFYGNSDVVLAQMRKQFTTEENNAFEVTIYPNVDYAFIIVLIIILHEIKNHSLPKAAVKLGYQIGEHFVLQSLGN